jgi:hypothetical protein
MRVVNRRTSPLRLSDFSSNTKGRETGCKKAVNTYLTGGSTYEARTGPQGGTCRHMHPGWAPFPTPSIRFRLTLGLFGLPRTGLVGSFASCSAMHPGQVRPPSSVFTTGNQSLFFPGNRVRIALVRPTDIPKGCDGGLLPGRCVENCESDDTIALIPKHGVVLGHFGVVGGGWSAPSAPARPCVRGWSQS